MASKTGLADSGTIQNIPSDSSIDRLPPDILGLIFSYLDWSDLEASVRLTKPMRDRLITVVNCNEPFYIQNFIRVLIQKLNGETFPVQRDSLIGIAQNITAQNFSNLSRMKEYILGLKAQLIDVLQTLDVEMINHLGDNTQLPHFMGNCFELAMPEKGITEANSIPDENIRAWALRGIARALAEAGNVDRAIKAARAIVLEDIRAWALRDIVRALAQAGNVDRAIEVARAFVCVRADALRDIAIVLVETGNMDRAIDVAGMISDEDVRSWSLGYIARALAQAGNMDRAIDLARMIHNKSLRDKVLRDIPGAINATRMIVDGQSRNLCLSMLTIILAMSMAHLILKIGSQRS